MEPWASLVWAAPSRCRHAVLGLQHAPPSTKQQDTARQGQITTLPNTGLSLDQGRCHQVGRTIDAFSELERAPVPDARVSERSQAGCFFQSLPPFLAPAR